MNYTANYQLPQWVETDRIMMEDFNEAMAKHPERVIEHAVKGMLPKNTLGRAMGKKLKVYAGPEHPHMAQKPREIKMEG